MKIERITEKLAPIASYIYASSWKSAYRGLVPLDFLDELSDEHWIPRFRRLGFQGFILSDDGKPVAVSTISPARDEVMIGWAEINSIYVLPELFQKGYGTVLFKYVLEQLLEQGFQKVYLWVFEENIRVQRFYEKMGFRSNGDKKILTIADKDLVELRYVYERK